MSFGAVFALAIALLVAAPVAAHLLRRRRTEDRKFPPARLIPATAPSARRRSLFEDRFLFGLRAASIIVLALLGASPFVSCSHLAIDRKSGASVALVLVVDDSLSMRMPADKKGSKLARAMEGARQLVKDGREGDSFAVVAAGAPPRIVLALTTDLGAAATALDSMRQSDRATDLDGAVALANGLLKTAPQVDKRVVLFTDRADGHANAAPLDADPDVGFWEPLPGLAAKAEADCGITTAERAGDRVLVHVVCTPDGSAAGRTVTVKNGKDSYKTATVDGPGSQAIALDLPKNTPDDVFAELSPGDALADDDRAPVSTAAPELGIGVIADPAKNRVTTGGPPPVEQAFAALDLASSIKVLSTIPEHDVDLRELSGIVLDDPPGLTPEQRSALSDWIDKGGVMLLTLGRSAGAAPLGAGFDGFLPGVVRYADTAVDARDPSKCAFFGASGDSLANLHVHGRAELDRSAVDAAELGCAFADGAPLLLRRDIGRGELFVLTLPFSLEESDVVLRPAFLTLLDRVVEQARAHGGTSRVQVGFDFTFGGAKKVEGVFDSLDGSPPTPIPVFERNAVIRATPALAGRYTFDVDGQRETRVAFVGESEIDLRPRVVVARAHDASLGRNSPRVDISRYVALVLLGLIAIELLARVVLRFAKPKPSPADGIGQSA